VRTPHREEFPLRPIPVQFLPGGKGGQIIENNNTIHTNNTQPHLLFVARTLSRRQPNRPLLQVSQGAVELSPGRNRRQTIDNNHTIDKQLTTTTQSTTTKQITTSDSLLLLFPKAPPILFPKGNTMAHQAHKKRVHEATSRVASGNILVVIQKLQPGLIKFAMPFNPSDDRNTLTTKFHDWIIKEDNNVDAINGSGPLFTYKKETDAVGVETVTFSDPNPIWAFQVRQLLATSSGSLRFTTSEALYEKINGEEMESVAKLIGESYDFLFLCDEYRFGENGEKGYGQLLDFCATKLVARQVCIYPPLSLLYFLSDKHNLRDPPLSELMLPNVVIPLQKTIQRTAKAAAKNLNLKYPGHSLSFDDKLVAKVTSSCGGLGVLFLEKKRDGNNRGVWSATRVGVEIPDKIEAGLNGLTLGQQLKFEPFISDLSTGEWRFYSSLRHHGTDKGLSNIYGLQTAMNPGDGLLKIQKMPNTYLDGKGNVISRETQQKMKALFKAAIDSLVGTQNPSWRGIRYLVFRFDCFVCQVNGEVYLNEIDIFPVANALMDDYCTCEDYIKELAQRTLNYMIEHSSDDSSWSM
jgi:hypothetical protein